MRAKVKVQPPEAAKAAMTAAEAAVAEADAALDEAKTNFDLTKILSPFKGFVFARRINVGQNVAPANGPGLFLIAKDTGKVQVWVSVNEADGGRIHEKTPAHFTVDGLPKDVFRGTVTQIRRESHVTRNMVTYTVVVEAETTNHTPMPYQKANVQFELGPETPAGGGPAKQPKTENTPTAARTPPATVGGEKATKPDVPWGDWNASWSVRLRTTKATWTSEELPEFTIDLRKREKRRAGRRAADLAQLAPGRGRAAVPVGVFTTSWEHKQVFELGTTRPDFITFHFYHDENGLHVRTGARTAGGSIPTAWIRSETMARC